MDFSITFINSTVDKLKKLPVDPTDIVSIGVTYQGETVVVWVGEVVSWWVMIIVPSHHVVRPEDQGHSHLPQHVLQELHGAGQEWPSYEHISQQSS